MPQTKRPPKYRLHKATGQAVIWLNGRDHYLGRHGTTASRQKYARLLAEWEANGQRLPVDRAKRLHVSQLVLAYWRACKGRYSAGTLYGIRSALKPLRELYGRAYADEFGPLALQAVRCRMVEVNGWSRSTVNASTHRITHCFKWGASQQLVPVEVYNGLRTVGGLRRGELGVREGRTVGPAPRASVRAVRREVDQEVRRLMALQLLTGARSGELLGLRRDDVNMSGAVWFADLADHKTRHHGKDRRIWFGPRAQKVLRPVILRRQGAELLFSYSTASYRRTIDRACRRAKRPRFHPHQLRHSAATRIRREHGLEASRVILGHASARVTDGAYAERSERHAREVMLKTG